MGLNTSSQSSQHVTVLLATLMVLALLLTGCHKTHFAAMLVVASSLVYISWQSTCSHQQTEYFLDPVTGAMLVDETQGYDRFGMLPRYAISNIGGALDKVVTALNPPGSNSGSKLDSSKGGDMVIMQTTFCTCPECRNKVPPCTCPPNTIPRNDPICDKGGDVKHDDFVNVTQEYFVINKFLVALEQMPPATKKST
jgi:hypothetical protein